jgi:hypothetical protein
MAQHGKKQQERLARKKAKRATKKAALARHEADLVMSLDGVETWPVFEAVVPEDLLRQGIGNLYLARRMPDGRLALGVYLLDTFCLGVKDCTLDVVTPSAYRLQVAQAGERARARYRPISPEAFAKLILDGVAYARRIGLEPHPNFEACRSLLDGIDPTACDETFEFGMDGKPHYIQGPYDSPARIARIVTAVRAAGGHFTILDVPKGWHFDDEVIEEGPVQRVGW